MERQLNKLREDFSAVHYQRREAQLTRTVQNCRAVLCQCREAAAYKDRRPAFRRSVIVNEMTLSH
jgi:hypothetical protein